MLPTAFFWDLQESPAASCSERTHAIAAPASHARLRTSGQPPSNPGCCKRFDGVWVAGSSNRRALNPCSPVIHAHADQDFDETVTVVTAERSFLHHSGLGAGASWDRSRIHAVATTSPFDQRVPCTKRTPMDREEVAPLCVGGLRQRTLAPEFQCLSLRTMTTSPSQDTV